MPSWAKRPLPLDFLDAVVDRVLHLRGHVGDTRDDVVEELLASALGLDHRELQRDVGEGEHRVDDAAQLVDVRARHHRVHREVEPAPREDLARRRTSRSNASARTSELWTLAVPPWSDM